MSDVPVGGSEGVAVSDSDDSLGNQHFSFDKDGLQEQDIRVVEKVVQLLTETFGIERSQVYLGALLIPLLLLAVFFVFCAWKFYSPVIRNFSLRESQERDKLRSEKEKEKDKCMSATMDAFKKFLKEKKVNKHFKRTGPGAKLSDLASSTNTPSIVTGSAQGGTVDRGLAADVAAQAALKRLYKEEPQVSSSQKKIQMLAQRELEKERQLQDPAAMLENLGLYNPTQTETKEFEHSTVIGGVKYTCELLGDDVALPKAELMKHIEEFLTSQFSEGDREDSVISAVLLLYSLNKKAQKDAAVEVLGKYLQNIIENPSEPKFRRIRMANKAFQERVLTAKGGMEYLLAIGFEKQEQLFKEGEPLEMFLVAPTSVAEDTGRLVQFLEVLREGESIPIKVARDTQVFMLRENERVPMAHAREFFELSPEEVKREQQTRTDEVNKLTALRTKEMRDRDEKLRNYSYKHTMLRIRLPDRFVVQAVFGCFEPFSAVRQYVHGLLGNAAAEFVLRDPSTGELNEDKSLVDLCLVPAAVLHLDWVQPMEGPVLAEQYRETVQYFS